MMIFNLLYKKGLCDLISKILVTFYELKLW
jgi:hypothetical protein